MKLLAISDLHVSSPANMQALAESPAFPDDWLIVAGDVAESMERLNEAFGVVRVRGGDPSQPYGFQCISAVPPGQFLCSPGGVVRYKPDPTVPAGQYPITIQVNNGTFPSSNLQVTLDVQVP